MEKKRSVGIIIFGVILIFVGLTTCNPGIFYFVLKEIIMSVFCGFNAFSPPDPQVLSPFFSLIGSLVALGFLLSGTGILLRKNWARKLAILSAIMCIFLSLYHSHFLMRIAYRPPAYVNYFQWIMAHISFILLIIWKAIINISTLFAIFVIVFLTRTKIKEICN